MFLYVFQRIQAHLLLSLGSPGVKPDQAWNTAASFVTNTNWQSYSGESTMGHLVQMAGLAVQNFTSAAVGVAGAGAPGRRCGPPHTHPPRDLCGRLGRHRPPLLLPPAGPATNPFTHTAP